MATDNNPPGATVDTCTHGIPVTSDCSRCDNAAEIGRPVGGGPRVAKLVVARRTTYCSCLNFIIAHEDKVGRVDGEWRCEDCVIGAAS